MLRWLFVDFNAFFASVEQQYRPELRGKPVGVVAVMTDRTCLITASYQARAYGVKTGTPVREALRRCPSLVLVEARPALYIQVHQELLDAISSCIPISQVCSIDEVLCQLHGNEQHPERACAIARAIKETVRRRVGEYITCSIGLAPNPFLAKTACDLEKPDGLVVLTMEDIPSRLLHLQLQDLSGIGPRMEQRLHHAGIHTVADLYAASRQQLRAIWGSIEGERFYAHLHGECTDRPPTRRRSVGHSHVLPPSLRTAELAFAVLHRLMQKATARLRRYKLAASLLAVSCTFLPQHEWKAELRLPPTNDPFVLGVALRQLWQQRPPNRTPFHVRIQFTDLLPASFQLTLPFEPAPRHRERLLDALDALIERYGPGIVYIATAHPAQGAAPMRIAFRSIPNPLLEDDHS
ncbi:MAG: helix-hairpin-helix domain-containing protein [Bacteroidota bacterium]|nr:helix-hairpin-helix domain-containing protein [Candidatus Kapabacteria bacterium]MCS7303167.1 helix-hairpin-helix domain-containing protein [Candidatus Kapabacteria bacterium]MDW8075864.1 helix-hairpin-helix domain-containing protein [Bacteroidota bacterium]MDW8271816.1 helix-hairpin-helix domain-containing protein [Bacteroidota bacterium]